MSDIPNHSATPTEGSFVLAGNLEMALHSAIEIAAARGDYRSAYVCGLKANLAYLRRYGTLEVRS